MKFSAVRNIAGLLSGLVVGLILTSPTVYALAMAPVLTLVSPGNLSDVSGTVTFAAAADSEGLVSLQFKVDGNDTGSAITSGSCRMSFDSRSVPDGAHTVQAIGQDQFGAMAVSSPTTIYVSNSSPAVGGISVYNVTASSATIGWVTAIAADSQVEYGPSPSYGSMTPRDWTQVLSHAQTLGGLAASTTYHFRVYSVSENGIVSQSGDFIFATTSTTGDPTPTPTPTPSPTPTPPVPTPTPPVTTPTPTPTVPTPTPTPHPTLPTPTPTPTPLPLGPTPTPTAPTLGGSQGGHGSTQLPNVRPSVPQIVLAPETGSLVTTPDRRQQPRVIDSGSAASAVARGGGSTSPKSTKPSTTPVPTPTPKPATPAPVPLIVYGKTSSSTTTTTDVPCSQPDPFKARGGVGMCVDGKWMSLWLPAGGGKKK